MAIQTEITRKDIGFIDDIDLRNILLERMKELDRVFLVNSNYSTIFLAISTIEGIFKHIAKIFRAEISKFPKYPLNSKKKRKKFDRLSINELYNLLKECNILPDIKRFEEIYSLFKDYRNFIHPQAQKRKDWPIDLGHAQMALGLLNATIGDLAQYRFIEKEIFHKIEGNPDYFGKVLQLNVHQTRLHSLLVLNRQVSNILSLKFDLELPQNSIFNFVFNFVNDGDFKFVRLDNRRNPFYTNGMFHCTQKYFWPQILYADPISPPEKSSLSIKIKIEFQKKMFSLDVDGQTYSFKDKQGNPKDLFNEIRPNLKIGFFNEVGTIRLGNIRLNVS